PCHARRGRGFPLPQGEGINTIPAPVAAGARTSGVHVHAVPERDVVRDLLGGVLGLRIEPRGVFVDLPVDHDVVVARRALPRAERVGTALAQMLAAYGCGREILIALDDDALIALRDDRSVPAGACHGCTSSERQS